MTQEVHSGRSLRQPAQPAAPFSAHRARPAKLSASPPAPALLTAAQAAQVLGVSERTFHYLRREGQVPAPVVLGPRLLRWVRSELEGHIPTLPRQESPVEPVQLLRGKVEKLKAAGKTY